MKRFVYSFSGLILAATAAHAQPAGDATGAIPSEAPSGVQGAPDASMPTESAAPANAGSDRGATSPAEAADPVIGSASPATPSAAVTDTDVDNFAKATVKLQQIQANASLAADQKQTAMAAAVSEAGLDPVKYNEIGAQVSADDALRARVQTAMARHAGHSDG